MEKRNHYWVLDCILALTAIALGTTALCSFAGLAAPAQSGTALGIELFVCVAAAGVAALFAGFVWRDQRQTGRRRHAVRAHQERHALMMRRESQRGAAVGVAPVAPAPAETYETPETLLVTSLTDVKAERRVQNRQQARRAEAVAEAAA